MRSRAPSATTWRWHCERSASSAAFRHGVAGCVEPAAPKIPSAFPKAEGWAVPPCSRLIQGMSQMLLLPLSPPSLLSLLDPGAGPRGLCCSPGQMAPRRAAARAPPLMAAAGTGLPGLLLLLPPRCRCSLHGEGVGGMKPQPQTLWRATNRGWGEEGTVSTNPTDCPVLFFFADKPNSYFTQTPPTPRDGEYPPSARWSLFPLEAKSWSLGDPVIYFAVSVPGAEQLTVPCSLPSPSPGMVFFPLGTKGMAQPRSSHCTLRVAAACPAAGEGLEEEVGSSRCSRSSVGSSAGAVGAGERDLSSGVVLCSSPRRFIGFYARGWAASRILPCPETPCRTRGEGCPPRG